MHSLPKICRLCANLGYLCLQHDDCPNLPDWFTENMKALITHKEQCSQCKQAARGRFAGATTEQINNMRCPTGQILGTAVIEETRELEKRGKMS